MDTADIQRVDELAAELENLWPKGSPRVEEFDNRNRSEEWWPERAVVVDSIPTALGVHRGEQRLAYPVANGWASFRYILHTATGVRNDNRLPFQLSVAGESAAIRLLEKCAEDIRAFQQEIRDIASRDGATLRQLSTAVNNAFVDLEVRAMFIDDALKVAHDRG